MELKAIATEYDGIVFRSRLEAQFYRYWQLQFKSMPKNTVKILYEPSEYFTTLWNPDLFLSFQSPGYASDNKCLVEIKPKTDQFLLFKYLESFKQFDIDMVILCSPFDVISISKEGKIQAGSPEESVFKQAQSDVYYFLKNGR